MPKGSPELTERRKNEILDACKKIYKIQGFYGVNIKEISTEISLTRPSIYNYFETKEEILLGLLSREYECWCKELEEVIPQAGGSNRMILAEKIAHTLEEKEILLRILNMNLFEIELNSRVERLAEFKKLYLRAITAFSDILRSYSPSISDTEYENFNNSFCAFLIGIYPFVFHTEKQKEAMKIAGMKLKEPTIYEMVYKVLIKLIPNK